MPHRRTFLMLTALTGLAAACSPQDDGRSGHSEEQGEGGSVKAERHAYGDDPAQYADLYRPAAGHSRGVVVVIHGGFWGSAYDASLGAPLAADLARRGWTAWNLEYRRVGNGGGLPQTFHDVAAGIDRLAEMPDLDLSTVVALGHSAGGHLAAWAAARGRFPSWKPELVSVTAVISQAGILDLTKAHAERLGGGAVERFLGEGPGPAYDEVDPMRQIPLDVPLWCVHGSADTIVPLDQSTDYVAAALAAGARSGLVEVEGDHFVVVDPRSTAWARTLALLDAL